MAIVPFKPPEWLGGMSSRSIQERMMQNLPLDIDKTEGGFVWDLTFPTALEKAELLQFHLIRTLHHSLCRGLPGLVFNTRPV